VVSATWANAGVEIGVTENSAVDLCKSQVGDETADAGRVLLAQTGTWVADLAGLAARFHLPTISELCLEVEHERQRGSFRVAVVGEANRGKSTVVNELLGAELMPTGPVALTSGLVFVRSSKSPRLDIEGSDGRLVSLPLRLESWAKLGEGDRVTVWTDTNWLRDRTIELVDTAGSNTTADDHLEAARHAIRQADAVILCVSAEQPMTETERRFITREVLRRQVPHVLVALTMADRLNPAALDTVTGRVRRLLDDLGGLELVIGPGTNPAATALLRDQLIKLAGLPGRALARARALATTLLDASELCETAAEAGREARQESVAAQAENLESLRRVTSEADAGWAKLLPEFDRKGRGLLQATRSQMDKDREDIIKRYFSELRIANDPLLWWKEVLPVKAHEDLKRHSMQYSANLRAQVQHDTVWLGQQAVTRLGYRAAIPAGVQVSALDADFVQPTEALTATSCRRRFARIAGNTGTLTGAAIGLAAGVPGLILFSAGGGLAGNLAGEKLLRHVNEQNVNEARPLLVAALNSSFDQLSRRISTLVPALYAEIGEDLRDGARRANDVRLNAAQAELEAQWRAAPDWDQLRAAASHVANNIYTALRTP